MAQVRLPNGKVIEVANDATQEEIKAYSIARGFATEQDFAPAPKEFDKTQTSAQQLASEQGPLDAFAISMGKGMTDVGRGLLKQAQAGRLGPASYAVSQLFEEPQPRSQQEIDAYAALQGQRPISTTIGEAVGQAAPLAPLGVSAGAIGQLAPRVAASAAIGAAETGLSSSGRDESLDEIIQNAGIGGAVAGGLEAVFPVVGRLYRGIAKRLGAKGQSLANSEAFKAALKNENIDLSSFSDDAISYLSSLPENADPVQAIRASKFMNLGMEPTRAQITRNATDFMEQQEAFKTSNRLRSALERQEGQISRLFDDRISATGGAPVNDSNSLINTVMNREIIRDNAIGEAYRMAREMAPGEKTVALDNLVSAIRRNSSENELTGGLYSAVVGDLKSRGIVQGRGIKRVGKIDAETAEQIRQQLNVYFRSTNDLGRSRIRELKDALDEDVLSAYGDDVFKDARQAKADFERNLSRAKINKFDARQKNIVRDILENKIDPDRFVDQVITSKSTRAEDLEQLKRFVIGEGEGQKAWNDTRAEALQFIKDSAFRGPVDENGYQAISRDSLQRALNKIGTPKLKVLFEPDELKFLKDVMDVAELREPVRGTAIGRGPSAQAIGRIEQQMKSNAFAGALISIINFDASGRVVLRSSPDVIISPSRISKLERDLVSGAVLGASAATANAAQEDNQ